MLEPSTRSAVAVAAQTLRAHPLRTVLSTLGVVMGVASLVAVLAIGDGVERYVREQITQTTDIQTIVVDPRIEDVVDGVRIPREDVARFTLATVDSLEAALGLTRSATLSTRGSALLEPGPGGKARAAVVIGVAPLFAEWGRPSYLAGRFFDEGETRAGATVAAITDGLLELVAPGTPPEAMLGRPVLLSGTPFTVVGVLRSKGKEKKTMAFVPVTVAERAMVPSPSARASQLLVRAPSVEAVDSTRAAVGAWLAPRFGAEGGSYEVQDGPVARLRQARQGILLFKIMMGAFAGISLLVGGIGIMNVLLAAVLERTREIGIRKAIGARKRDILVQFLSESAVISGAGAVVGIALGLGGAFAVSSLMRRLANATIQAAFSWPSVVSAAVIAVGIGLAFGMYPAVRAARLSPVDAMRTE